MVNRILYAILVSQLLCTSVVASQAVLQEQEIRLVGGEATEADLDQIALQLQMNPGIVGRIVLYPGRSMPVGMPYRLAMSLVRYLVDLKGIQSTRVRCSLGTPLEAARATVRYSATSDTYEVPRIELTLPEVNRKLLVDVFGSDQMGVGEYALDRCSRFAFVEAALDFDPKARLWMVVRVPVQSTSASSRWPDRPKSVEQIAIETCQVLRKDFESCSGVDVSRIAIAVGEPSDDNSVELWLVRGDPDRNWRLVDR